MAKENEVNQPAYSFLNSIALSVNTSQGLRHVQFSIFEDDETHVVKAFFDVVNPSDVAKG